MISRVLLGRGGKRLFATVSVLLATGLALLSSQALALSAGRIQVASHLNEPFRASVKLSSLQPGELQQLQVRLADDAAYAALGVEKSQFLTSLKFAVNETGDDTAALVSISSRQSAKEPFFSFLVEFQGSAGRLVREYTVLLDPNTGPRVTDQQAVSPAAANQATVIAPQPTMMPAPVAQPVATAAPQPTPRIAAPSPLEFESNQPILRGQEADQAEQLDRYGPVKAGSTLWQIAAEVRPDPKLSVNQVMWALFTTNPEQFNGNLNSIKRGAVLQVPSADLMYDVSAPEANALIAEEAARYELQRSGLASRSTQSDAEPATETLSLEAVAEDSVVDYTEAATVDVYEPLAADDAAEASVEEMDSYESSAAEPELIPEPEDAPVEVVEELAEVAIDELPELPVEPSSDLEQASGDELAAVSAENAAADADNYADLPPLPSDEEESGGFDAALELDTQSDEESGSFLTIVLGLISLLVIGALILLGLRRKSSDSEPNAAVSDYAAPSVSAPRTVESRHDAAAGLAASPFDAPAAATEDQSGVETIEVDDSAEDTDLHEETDFELPDLDTLAEQDAAAGLTPAAEETNEIDFGDTEISQAPSAAEYTSSDMTEDAGDDLGGDGTLDLGTDTVSLELNEDPVSEADFQLAYGLYDEAALLLNRAIENDPARLELHEKLAETYFAAGNADGFQKAAVSLKQQNPDGDTWQRIAIMGQQLCPDDGMFAGDLDASSATVDLDMDFAGDSAAEDSQVGDSAQTVSDADDNLLEFDLDESSAPEPAGDESLSAAPEVASDDDFEADFGSLELDADADDELADIGDLDLGDLEAELEGDDAQADAALEPELSLDDESFSGDTVAMEAMTPEADAAEEPESNDLDLEPLELDVEPEQQTPEPTPEEPSFEAADDNSIEFEMPDLEPVAESSSDDVPAVDGLSDDSLSLEEPGEDNSGDDFELSLDAASEETDFDLGDLGDDLGAATDFDLSDTDASSTDFDLTDLELDSSGDSGSDDNSNDDFELSLSDDSATDFDLDDLGGATDFDLSDSDDASDISGGDEAGTKLDLARAYADMPDEKDMARNLLNEVLEVGSDEQKAEAQQLLDQL